MVKKISKKQVEVFKKELAMRLSLIHILNYYEKKEAQEAFREMSRSARYWKMVSEHRWSKIKELMERLHRWNGSGKRCV